MFRKIILLSILVIAASAGCVDVATESAPPALPEFVTATLPPSALPQPTQTPLPPTAVPTLPPIEGTTNTQVNVRAETNTASESLGVIPPFTPVQITGREETGTWYQILYAGSPTGAGWVRAEFLQVQPSAEIQVLDVAAGFGSGANGLVISGINVRGGPGTEFESLGVLTPKDVVLVVGRDESGAWLQFLFNASPDGTGWGASEFMQVNGLDALPVITVAGEHVDDAAADVDAPQENPQIALQDGDTRDAPLVYEHLTPGGVGALQVSGNVSAPEGDVEDWVAFSSDKTGVTIQIACEPDLLLVELWQGGTVQEALSISCGDGRFLKIVPDVIYSLRLTNPENGTPQFVRYVVKIEASR